jgi:hypothetical protein
MKSSAPRVPDSADNTTRPELQLNASINCFFNELQFNKVASRTLRLVDFVEVADVKSTSPGDPSSCVADHRNEVSTPQVSGCSQSPGS